MKSITKKDFFYNNDCVNHNASELYSCLKICHGKDIDGEELLKFAWKYDKERFATQKLSMWEISVIGEKINNNFNNFFKITAR